MAETTHANASRPTMAEIINQNNAIMAFEGFEITPQKRALDAALLAGRATINQTMEFTLLKVNLDAAQSILESIGAGDARHATIMARCAQEREALRSMAQAMGGDVSRAHGL